MVAPTWSPWGTELDPEHLRIPPENDQLLRQEHLQLLLGHVGVEERTYYYGI